MLYKSIPEKRKRKKAKCLSEEPLQVAEKRREVKGKGGKERYTELSAEFQRIGRRDKKAFLSEQCTEIKAKKKKKNPEWGKNRDLFKKIRATKGTYHTRMDTIKDGNCKDLTEAEDIKKGSQEYGCESWTIKKAEH